MQDRPPQDARAPTPDVGLTLAPGVRQEPVLSPQLRASLRVLQMDWQMLVGEIRHEAEVNPVVDVDEPDNETTISDQVKSEERLEGQNAESLVEDESNPSVNIDEDAAERRQRFFDRQVAVESLQEHLMAQVGAAGFSEADRPLAELIIGDVDDDGRYVGSLEELSSVTGAGADRLESVLRRVQDFDPPGVAGRDLRECLGIQIRQQILAPSECELLLRIVGEHLGSVAESDLDALMRHLGVTKAECLDALKILRSLEPKPGRPFLANGKHPQFIHPELDIAVVGEELKLTSNESDLPTVTINPFYRDMLDDPNTSKDARQYLHERISDAEQLVEAVHRRGETILKVAEAVFSTQREFFSRGFESLKPLTIEEVARRTGYHGTTVGRAVRGKYVRTPRGVFELRKFFCVGHVAGGGSAVSAVSVKCRLAELIQAETDGSLTDEELVEALAKSGLTLSRRTVAKYRAELGIPSAAERFKQRRFT